MLIYSTCLTQPKVFLIVLLTKRDGLFNLLKLLDLHYKQAVMSKTNWEGIITVGISSVSSGGALGECAPPERPKQIFNYSETPFCLLFKTENPFFCLSKWKIIFFCLSVFKSD
jgi:hypothetical protein